MKRDHLTLDADGRPLRAGHVCELVNLTIDEQYNGKIVTVVAPSTWGGGVVEVVGCCTEGTTRAAYGVNLRRINRGHEPAKANFQQLIMSIKYLSHTPRL